MPDDTIVTKMIFATLLRFHTISRMRTCARLPGIRLLACLNMLLGSITLPAAPAQDTRFEGKHYAGRGDIEYLQLLDISRRMFESDAEFQNITMLYEPKWNGLVEGPTWDAWWIQNSYGTTYSILPFLQEPFTTFLQNSHDLWFNQMGDGKRKGANPPFDWVAPDGCLCDAARPGWIVYKQGDGRTAIHDWGMEFTAAGLLMQSELLLISRDPKAAAHYLPMLERCAEFIETRRDPKNNLFLAGPAGNLLAPSYAGWKKPDGTYDKAYLAGLSVTYIAALDRLAELEKLAGRSAKVSLFQQRRAAAKEGLAALATPEGYFIRSLDPDGTKHGVFGAEKHGYFEASPNHDAVAFRVADDAQARAIMNKIASIPGLRPHEFILPNFPSYDDMYEKPEGLWGFGTWVNGGHWSTCEARMQLAYSRLGQFEDARRSMRKLLSFAERFRMDNPLTKCGSDVYQPKQPINLCYDTFGPAAGFMRGLFEYLYRADTLTLWPHIPPYVTELDQLDPVRFGEKRIFISTAGKGPVTSVRVNGRIWKSYDASSVVLTYADLPVTAHVQIALGKAKLPRYRAKLESAIKGASPQVDLTWPEDLKEFKSQAEKFSHLCRALADVGLSASPEAAQARLTADAFETICRRRMLQGERKIKPLPAASQAAGDKAYVDAANRLAEGMATLLKSYADSSDMTRRKLHEAWLKVAN
jgi:hypothetical protein